jgi:hypothetical protein
VTDAYERPYTFAGGTLRRVVVEVSDQALLLDLDPSHLLALED